MNQPERPSLQLITDAMIASYHTDDRTQHIDSAFLPDREKAVKLIELLRELLFPGYFGSRKWSSENIQFHIGEITFELRNVLDEQIESILRYEKSVDEACSHSMDEIATKARGITDKFIAQLPDVRTLLATDVQAAYDGDPAAINTDESIYCYPGVYAVFIYRVAHLLYELNIPILPRMMTEHAHALTGIDIHPGAQIGPSFFIDHGTGVVIGETTEIGKNVKLYQGVTLGAFSFPKDERGRVIRGVKRHPTLEAGVTIYANATVLGGDTVIGEKSVVGAGVFITRSVPANHTVSTKMPELKVKEATESQLREGNEGTDCSVGHQGDFQI